MYLLSLNYTWVFFHAFADPKTSIHGFKTICLEMKEDSSLSIAQKGKQSPSIDFILLTQFIIIGHFSMCDEDLKVFISSSHPPSSSWIIRCEKVSDILDI